MNPHPWLAAALNDELMQAAWKKYKDSGVIDQELTELGRGSSGVVVQHPSVANAVWKFGSYTNTDVSDIWDGYLDYVLVLATMPHEVFAPSITKFICNDDYYMVEMQILERTLEFMFQSNENISSRVLEQANGFFRAKLNACMNADEPGFLWETPDKLLNELFMRHKEDSVDIRAYQFMQKLLDNGLKIDDLRLCNMMLDGYGNLVLTDPCASSHLTPEKIRASGLYHEE